LFAARSNGEWTCHEVAEMKFGLRGLFLDFDGTIAETERFGQRVAYNRAFAELGLDWFWDEALYGDLLAVAGGKERLRFYLESHRPELLDGAIAAGLIGEIHQAKIRHFAEIAPAIPLRPGLLRLVREANAAGVKVAIATTASQPGVEALLSQDRDLPAMIDLIAANEAVERKKPEPDIYVWALTRLGLSAADCVAIEDSNVGLRAALAAHLPTIVTVSDYTAEEDFAGATAVVSNLGEADAPALSLYGMSPKDGVVGLAFLDEIRISAGRQAAL
jgi:HAD superfamily hydrolase (TIGR01509 family)